jgi:hypothetical protein
LGCQVSLSFAYCRQIAVLGLFAHGITVAHQSITG